MYVKIKSLDPLRAKKHSKERRWAILWFRLFKLMLKISNLQYFPLAPFARSIGSLMRLLDSLTS